MLYFVECQHGNNKYIFARSFDHAAEHFVTWQTANEVEMGSFSIYKVKKMGSRKPAAAHLQQAIQLGLSGIASYSAEHGWSLDHD